MSNAVFSSKNQPYTASQGTPTDDDQSLTSPTDNRLPPGPPTTAQSLDTPIENPELSSSLDRLHPLQAQMHDLFLAALKTQRLALNAFKEETAQYTQEQSATEQLKRKLSTSAKELSLKLENTEEELATKEWQNFQLEMQARKEAVQESLYALITSLDAPDQSNSPIPIALESLKESLAAVEDQRFEEIPPLQVAQATIGIASTALKTALVALRALEKNPQKQQGLRSAIERVEDAKNGINGWNHSCSQQYQEAPKDENDPTTHANNVLNMITTALEHTEIAIRDVAEVVKFRSSLIVS